MMNIECTLIVEDALSELVLRKTIAHSTTRLRPTSVRVAAGYGAIKNNIRAYNRAAQSRPYVILTDLDRTVCPSILLADWFRGIRREPRLLFRVAVREVESWVLADRQSVADLFGIRTNLVPENPDSLIDPKQALVSLAGRSRNRKARQALIPIGTAKQGPDYNDFLGNFIATSWQASVAETCSPSLARAMFRFREFVDA